MIVVHPMMANIIALADHATWQQTIAAVDDAVSKWLVRRERIHLSRVYFVGCGTSLYAGQVGKYVVERIVRLPAEAVQGFAFATYAEPEVLGPETLVVGISTTGGTAAVSEALAHARQAGAPTLGITANPEAGIARVADAILPTIGGYTISVKTKTYVQSLIAIYLLALHLLQDREQDSVDLVSYWRQQIELAANGTKHFLDQQQAEVERLAEQYAESTNVFVLGTGPNIGTAEEASLKVIEMAKMYSEAQELENFMHGRLREVDEFNPIFILAPQGRATERVLDFLTVTDHVGAPSIVLTDRVTPDIERLAKHVIRMPGNLDEFATPLLYIVPLYLFEYHLALRRGHDPTARRYPDIVPQEMRYRDLAEA